MGVRLIGFALLLCSLSPTFVRAAGLGEPCEDAEDCAHSGLICNHRQMVCEFCTTDAQCADHGAFICGEQGDGEHEESEPGFDGEKGARHCARVTLEPQSPYLDLSWMSQLPLFDDFPVDDMYASVAVFIGGVLAAGGGLGGGGMFVPFFILVAHLRTHEAIPLSQVEPRLCHRQPTGLSEQQL